MEQFRLSKYYTVGLLLLALTSPLQAQELSQTQKLASALQGINQNDKIAFKQQMLEYAMSVLKVPPSQVLTQKQILATDILDLSEKSTTDQEKKILFMWADMVEKKTLKKNIQLMIEELKKNPSPVSDKIKNTPELYINYATDTLAASIEATVKMRGMTSDSIQNKYSEWFDLSTKMIGRLDSDTSADPLIFSNSKAEISEMAEILVDGEASFAKREALMVQAKNSINILTWSVYDDVTGTALADLLIEKKKQNKKIDIRIIVDGQVALQYGRNAQLKRMNDAGIQVISWFSKSNSYMGQHRKMIIIDGEHMIAGGLNYGDVYSHKNPDPKVAKWRDTDVYVKGAGAVQGYNLFAKIWNEQIKEQKITIFQKIASARLKTNLKSGISVSVIDNDPRKLGDGSNIMMTILKSIRNAKVSVDIQNAYIILFPALKIEIENAIKKGVKVRILTNSAQSVDEPIVSIPILRSVIEFIKMGAEVFVKKGATLHSKLLIVDSKISMIMSYNLHPRSERVEGEMAVLINDEKFASDLTAVFNEDISEEKAQIINRTEDLVMPSSPVAIPTLRLFFDML